MAEASPRPEKRSSPRCCGCARRGVPARERRRAAAPALGLGVMVDSAQQQLSQLSRSGWSTSFVSESSRPRSSPPPQAQSGVEAAQAQRRSGVPSARRTGTRRARGGARARKGNQERASDTHCTYEPVAEECALARPRGRMIGTLSRTRHRCRPLLSAKFASCGRRRRDGGCKTSRNPL
jgi:hypothetical protein